MRLLPLSLVVLSLLSALLPACRRRAAEGGAPSGVATSAPAGATAGVAHPATASAAEPAPVSIGYAALPERITAEARSENGRALELHRRGDFVGAKGGFERAVELSPDYSLARFNLACAEAKLGALDAAAAEVARLLEQDPFDYRRRYLEDDDLAALRASEQGAGLNRLLARVESVFQRALAEGVPAVLWRGGNKSVLEPEVIRAGVYWHASRRFVALTPALPGIGGALFDSAHGKSLTVHAPVVDCGTDFCPRLVQVEVTAFPVNAWGEPGAKLAIHSEFRLTAVRMDAENVEVLDLSTGPQPVLWTLGPKLAVRTTTPWAPAGAVLTIDEHGAALQQMAPGYAIKGRMLVVPGGAKPIDLGKDHQGNLQSVVPAPDGRSVIVVTSRDGCICARVERSILEHTISRVDLDSRKVTPVEKGPGSAFARFDARGAMYLQSDRELRRVEPAGGADAAGGTVMAGVLLVPPREASSTCCGL